MISVIIPEKSLKNGIPEIFLLKRIPLSGLLTHPYF